MSKTTYEYCFLCERETGRAGAVDDSIYCEHCYDDGEDGPFCEECWEAHKKGHERQVLITQSQLSTLEAKLQVAQGNFTDMSTTIEELQAENDRRKFNQKELNEEIAALKGIMSRMLDDHTAPDDCYSTGPLTGTRMDEVCPSCEAIAALKQGS